MPLLASGQTDETLRVRIADIGAGLCTVTHAGAPHAGLDVGYFHSVAADPMRPMSCC